MFTKELLEGLVDGPAMMIGCFANTARQDIIEMRKKRKLRPFTAKDWQHLANAIAHPTRVTTPKMREAAKKLKQRIKPAIKRHLEHYIEDEDNDISDELADEIMDQWNDIEANWDWEMFANGLLIDGN